MKHPTHFLVQLVLVILLLGGPLACQQPLTPAKSDRQEYSVLTAPQTGAEQLSAYLPLLKDRSVGLVVNHTSRVGKTHLLDTLLSLGIRIERVFSPEHGFRGDLPDGHQVADGEDPITGTKIVSLYGRQKKPLPKDLEQLDVLVFDIQDLGIRCYTYISTLQLVMEAAAGENIPVLLLDRPNPFTRWVDGPVLEKDYSSFVGLNPIPLVYGMTIGEYAQMINNEHWLRDNLVADLKVIPCTRLPGERDWQSPVAPSPNLPNTLAISLYPSLVLFEGTQISVGRGTDAPFQLFGHPDLPKTDFSFVPYPNKGSQHPPLEGATCFGTDLRHLSPDSLLAQRCIELDFLIRTYRDFPDKSAFFRTDGYFEKLVGTAELRKQLETGETEAGIRASWQSKLDTFRDVRNKYLLYPR